MIDNGFSPMPPDKRVSNTFNAYLSRFAPMVAVSLLLLGIPALIVALVGNGAYTLDQLTELDWYNWSDGGLQYSDFMYTIQDIITDYYQHGGAAAAAISTLAAIFITPLAYGAIAAIAAARFRGESLGFGGAMSFAAKNFAKLLGTNFCAWLVFIGALIAATLALFVLIFLLAFLTYVANFIGIILIIGIAVVYTVVVLAMAGATMTSLSVASIEDLSGFKAVKRAWSLMFTRMWYNIGTMFVVSLATGAFTMLCGRIIGLAGGTVAEILNTAVSYMVQPLLMCVYTMVYFASRHIRGEFDVLPTLDLPPRADEPEQF